MMFLSLPKKNRAEEGEARRPRQKRKRKTLIVLLAAIVLISGAAVGAKALFFTEETQVALTEKTTYGSLATTIEGTGITVPADSLTVTTASTAAIEEVFVKAGDTVQVGDPLYTQDDSELDDQIEEYESSIADLEEELETSREQLSELQETLSDLTVTAPFSGRIIEVSVEEGDQAMKDGKLAVLVNDETMELTQYFSYAYEDQIYVGMKAGISVASLMTNRTGTVTEIQKVDRVTAEGTHCFAVTVSLENPGALTEGMTGAGYLIADSGEQIYPAVEGTLEYSDSETLTAQVSGELTLVKPAAYEKVSQGETLFVIDGSDYETQITSANRKITQTQERIASYQKKIAEVEEKRSDYTVTSELAGKIIMVGIKVGEKPRQAGQTAVSIYNLDSMTISANIDELDIDSIEMGMEVEIVQSGAESDTRYTGTVSEISYEATNTNGVAYFPVTVTIPSEGALSAGVNVSYTIAVGDAEEGVLAPIAALKSTGEGTCLFVKADSRPENAVDLEGVDVPEGFYAVPVEVGIMNSRYAKILSGVEQDAEVFTRYQQPAPSNGSTTSEGQDQENGEFDFQQGGRPDFSGMPGGMQGGGMPSGMSGGPMG